MGDVLPFGRFSPSRGIIVDRTDKSIQISGVMELYGPEATGARATSIESSINSMWTSSFPDGYKVTTKIRVKFRGPKSVAGNATQIEAVNMTQDSFVGVGMSGRYMTLNAKNRDVFTWVAAHEFGHIIGLDDRYLESIFSRIGGLFGAERTTPAESGYEGNVMAAHGGALTSQNLADIGVENEPSPYWINDDDYVASWVNIHPNSDVTGLPTASKLRAFETLMSGWVSTDDLDAMVRICGSVKSKTEADAIRKAVDPRELGELGQRTTLRLAMDKMPW